MKLSHRIENEICILSLEGQLMEDEIPQVRAYTKPLIEDESFKGVVFNLTRMKYIDSSGFGWLISVFRVLKSHDTTMAICHVNTEMEETFKMVRVDKMINLFSTEEEALKSIMQ